MSTLVIALGVGIPLLVFTILSVVFSVVRRAVARARAAIVGRRGARLRAGLDQDSVPKLSFSVDVRIAGSEPSPRLSRATRERLLILKVPQHYGLIPRACLGAFTVGTENGRLRLHSDRPPNATGTVDFYVPVGDPATWVEALTRAGARRDV